MRIWTHWQGFNSRTADGPSHTSSGRRRQSWKAAPGGQSRRYAFCAPTVGSGINPAQGRGSALWRPWHRSAAPPADSLNREVFGYMRRGRLRGGEVAALEARSKRPRGLGLYLLAQVVPKQHLSGVLDEVLYHPLVAIVGKQSPIDLRLAVSLKERRTVFARCVSWLSDKNEVSLSGSQHHVVPIDDEYIAGPVTQQVARMQVCVTDDVWPGLCPEHACELVHRGEQRVNRRSVFCP